MILGFMGITHALLSLLAMAIMMILPGYYPQSTFGVLKHDILLFIVCLVVLTGGALLPDLDNSESTAKHDLGIIGSMFMLFMRSTSSIIWNIYHFKGDNKPNTQHRYLWHTPIVSIGLIALLYFNLPSGNYTIFTNLKNSITTHQFGRFLQTNTFIIFLILLCFVSVLCGTSMLLKLIEKFVRLPFYVKYIFPLLSLGYIFTTTYTNLRIIGLCIGVGYFLHCIEDFFCDTGIPLLWPIPKFWGKQKKVWWRPWLPLRVTTGGIVNTIINILAGLAAISVFVYAFVTR